MCSFQQITTAILLASFASVAAANVGDADKATVLIKVYRGDDWTGVGSGFSYLLEAIWLPTRM